ncbi:MAG: hypothetical protein LBB88_04970, partial [Planctomycetaceae bacterium]|nr:hypothetical protein [Planctomycetaceae bacterium]
KFPIPEEERLPVIDTPITEREWMLLEFATKNVKIPIVEVILQPHETVRKDKFLYDITTQKLLTSPTLLQVADDGKSGSGSLLKMMQTESNVKINNIKFHIETRLDNKWQLNFLIENKDTLPVIIERVRIGSIPAFQSKKNHDLWNFNLQMFNIDYRKQILEQPIFVQLSNGYQIKCVLPF